MIEELPHGTADADPQVIPNAHPRAGWEEAFQQMASRGDDTLRDADALGHTEWDDVDWEW